MSVLNIRKQYYVDTNGPYAIKIFSDSLYNCIKQGMCKGNETLVFICIGTDRSTGDSLGPLSGYKMRYIKSTGVHVFGDLDNPVHAKNLDFTVKKVYDQFQNPYVVAIDACLGKLDHVGYITVGDGPLKPGLGVKKELSPVGNAHITGVVNYGGFMDFLVLQNTRLNVVMKMAEIISAGAFHVVNKLSLEGAICY